MVPTRKTREEAREALQHVLYAIATVADLKLDFEVGDEDWLAKARALWEKWNTDFIQQGICGANTRLAVKRALIDTGFGVNPTTGTKLVEDDTWDNFEFDTMVRFFDACRVWVHPDSVQLRVKRAEFPLPLARVMGNARALYPWLSDDDIELNLVRAGDTWMDMVIRIKPSS